MHVETIASHLGPKRHAFLCYIVHKLINSGEQRRKTELAKMPDVRSFSARMFLKIVSTLHHDMNLFAFFNDLAYDPLFAPITHKHVA